LGRALSPGAARQDRHASLRRDLRGDKILLTTLRTHEEVREAEEIGHPDLPLPDPPMLEIAERIIDQSWQEIPPDAILRDDLNRVPLHAHICERAGFVYCFLRGGGGT